MHPLGPTSSGFQGSSSLGAEQALWLDTQGTRPAQPATCGYLEDPVACLGREQGGHESEALANLHLVSSQWQTVPAPAWSYQARQGDLLRVTAQGLLFACVVTISVLWEGAQVCPLLGRQSL